MAAGHDPHVLDRLLAKEGAVIDSPPAIYEIVIRQAAEPIVVLSVENHLPARSPFLVRQAEDFDFGGRLRLRRRVWRWRRVWRRFVLRMHEAPEGNSHNNQTQKLHFHTRGAGRDEYRCRGFLLDGKCARARSLLPICLKIAFAPAAPWAARTGTGIGEQGGLIAMSAIMPRPAVSTRRQQPLISPARQRFVVRRCPAAFPHQL